MPRHLGLEPARAPRRGTPRRRRSSAGPCVRLGWSSSARTASRTAPRSTLPESVRGSSSTMRISVGQLVAGQAACRACVEQVVGGDASRDPARSSTAATGTAPSRASATADDRRAAHAGMALERGAHVVGPHLEAAADDRLVGAAEDPQEAVGVDAGQVGGADPVAVVAELAGLDLEQPLLVGAERLRRSSASTTRSSQPGVGAADAAPLGRPERLRGRRGSSRRRRRRTRWPRTRRAPGRRTCRGTRRRRRATAAPCPRPPSGGWRSSAGSRSASSTMRSAAGTRLAVVGRWRRTASTQPSTVNRSSSANERPSLTHCRTRNSPPRWTSGELTMATPDRRRARSSPVALVVLGAEQHPLERRVGQRRSASAARWSRWSASRRRRRAAALARRAAVAVRRDDLRRPPSVVERDRGRRRPRRDRASARSSARADDGAEVERGDVVAGALDRRAAG